MLANGLSVLPAPHCDVAAEFAPVEGVGLDLTKYRVIYTFFVMVGFAMVGYKMYQLGLLPITSADWTSLIPPFDPASRTWGSHAFV
jgi:hypothetical protein